MREFRVLATTLNDRIKKIKQGDAGGTTAENLGHHNGLINMHSGRANWKEQLDREIVNQRGKLLVSGLISHILIKFKCGV